MQANAVIIFAKSPESGDVKTRLRGRLDKKQRVELYTALLEDTVAKLGAVSDADTFIAYWPADGGGYFRRYGLEAFAQVTGDLGRKMHMAMAELLDKGYDRVVLVGTDIPGLSEDVVLDALGLLDSSDVVFGPATDGGYYLVGLKKPSLGIFNGIRWSSPQTLGQCAGLARELGLAVSYTRELSDIDTPEDLDKFLRGQ